MTKQKSHFQIISGKMRGQSEVYHLPPVEEDDKAVKVAKPDSKTNLIKQTVEAQALAGTIKTRAAGSSTVKTSLKQIQLPTAPVPQARLFDNR